MAFNELKLEGKFEDIPKWEYSNQIIFFLHILLSNTAKNSNFT